MQYKELHNYQQQLPQQMQKDNRSNGEAVDVSAYFPLKPHCRGSPHGTVISFVTVRKPTHQPETVACPRSASEFQNKGSALGQSDTKQPLLSDTPPNTASSLITQC